MTALQAGIGHHVVTREDGSVWACYDWSATPRRRPVRLKHDRDGNLVPVDRGERGEQTRAELSGLYRIGGRSRRGRDPGHGVASEALCDEIDLRRAEMQVSEAIEAVAREWGWSIETVRSHYYRRANKAE